MPKPDKTNTQLENQSIIREITEEPTDPEEEKLFTSLRASDWNEFIGQEKLKQSLHIAITASKKRDEAMEHVRHRRA